MDERVIADPTASADSDSELRRPRFRFLARRFPPFTRRQWRVFGISTTAGFFDTYDGALLSLALRQIQQSLRIAEAGLGAMLSAIRLGYLGALLIAPFADVFGRRRLLLYTIIGYTIFTAVTALARDERGFLTAQVLARSFSGAEATVSLVILTEEVGAAVRGWAIGMQTALAICGYGLAAIVFAFIASVPYGWRGLYALALLPLLLIIPLRRILPESHRFEAEAAAGARPRNVFEPLAAVFKTYPRRMGAIFTVWFLYAMGAAPAGMFVPKYLQEIHRWAPGQVSLLYIFGGAIGIIGAMFAGRISDSVGRRRVGIAFMSAGPLFEFAIFTIGGNAVSAMWVAWVFCDQASSTILNAYGAELFPTSQRSSAASVLMIARNLGGAAGLLGEAMLYGVAGGHWNAIRILLLFWFAATIVLMLTFPETAGYELETIAPEKSVGGPLPAESR